MDRVGRRGEAAALARQLSCLLAVRAPPLLAELRAYFLDSSVLSARPAVAEAAAARASTAAVACRVAPSYGRSSSDDGAGELLVDTEDEPGTPPTAPPGMQLSRARGPGSSVAGSSIANGDAWELAGLPAQLPGGGEPASAPQRPEDGERNAKEGEGAAAAAAERHWLWLTFRDRALEARFRAFQATQLAKVWAGRGQAVQWLECSFLRVCSVLGCQNTCMHRHLCSSNGPWCTDSSCSVAASLVVGPRRPFVLCADTCFVCGPQHDTLSYALCMVVVLATGWTFAATAPWGAAALVALCPVYAGLTIFKCLDVDR